MADVTISYKNNEIATMNATGVKTLLTGDTFCEDDIVVAYTKPATPAPTLQAKTNISPTTSSQTITADNGYDGLSSVQINAMPSGSAATPATTITANPSISVSSGGLITASNSKTQSVTPTVSAGYVSSGTAGTITVSGSNTSQLTTQGATTYNVSSSNQTITSGKYLTGTQTIRGVAVSNTLTAANIKSGVTITVGDSANASRITSVTGTYSGGGGGGASVGESVAEGDGSDTIVFSDLAGEPVLGVIMVEDATSASGLAFLYFDNMPSAFGYSVNSGTIESTTEADWTYENGTLTLTISYGFFDSMSYVLAYAY